MYNRHTVIMFSFRGDFSFSFISKHLKDDQVISWENKRRFWSMIRYFIVLRIMHDPIVNIIEVKWQRLIKTSKWAPFLFSLRISLLWSRFCDSVNISCYPNLLGSQLPIEAVQIAKGTTSKYTSSLSLGQLVAKFQIMRTWAKYLILFSLAWERPL